MNLKQMAIDFVGVSSILGGVSLGMYLFIQSNLEFYNHLESQKTMEYVKSMWEDKVLRARYLKKAENMKTSLLEGEITEEELFELPKLK